MALTRTTLSSAVASDDTTIRVASATGFGVGYFIRIDDEDFIQTAAAVGTVIPVRGGINGTARKAHPTTAGVVVGIATDWQTPEDQLSVPYPLAGRARTVASYTAAGAITLPVAGADALAIINGTSALAMTVAAPGKDLEGSMLWISSNGAGAHTVTFTGGLSGAGASYDVITINATAPVTLGPFVAINELWQMCVAVPLAGTVTNITATVA